MDPENSRVTENKFNKKLQQMLTKKTDGKQSITKQEYSCIIEKVEAAKEVTPRSRTEEQTMYLRKYDVIKVGRMKKLIAPIHIEGQSPRYFVHTQELFNILHQFHIRMKHGSTNRMHKELKSKYRNITKEVIRAYVNSCARCVKNVKDWASNLPKREVQPKIRTRGQVECIKMYPRGRAPYLYHYLMMYHDFVSNYDVARPLATESVEKIAEVLLDIFSLFGTPDILQTLKEGEFIQNVVEEIHTERPGIEIEPEEIQIEQTWKTLSTGVIVERDPNLLNIGDIFTSWTYEVANRLQRKLSDVVEARMWRRTSDKPTSYDAMFVRNLDTNPKWSHLSGYTLAKVRSELWGKNSKFSPGH